MRVKSPILFSEFPYQLNRDANIEKKRTFGWKENAKSIWAGKKNMFCREKSKPNESANRTWPRQVGGLAAVAREAVARDFSATPGIALTMTTWDLTTKNGDG